MPPNRRNLLIRYYLRRVLCRKVIPVKFSMMNLPKVKVHWKTFLILGYTYLGKTSHFLKDFVFQKKIYATITHWGDIYSISDSFFSSVKNTSLPSFRKMYFLKYKCDQQIFFYSFMPELGHLGFLGLAFFVLWGKIIQLSI